MEGLIEYLRSKGMPALHAEFIDEAIELMNDACSPLDSTVNDSYESMQEWVKSCYETK